MSDEPDASAVSPLRGDAIAVLERWRPPDDPRQRDLRRSYLALLRACADATSRECLPAHLTASALVLDHSLRQVLLTLHPKVGRWLQLGGHCEAHDPTLAAAARREAVEESGIATLGAPRGPVQLDSHPVRCGSGGPATHLDVQYVVVAPPAVREVVSAESAALGWWPVDGLPDGADDSVRALVSRALLVVGR